MIIECGTCNSRFRLDESKITGKGARVRCRKCGEAITVMKEDVDGLKAAATAGPAPQDEGLDLRSLLRETMEAPEPPEAEPSGVDALQSDLEKMLAGAGQAPEAAAPAPGMSAGGRPPEPPAAPDGPEPRESMERPEAPGGPSVDFGPEEAITFLKPGGGEPVAAPPAEAPAPAKEPPRPGAPAAAQPPARSSSSEFVMSTADALDFLKADYDKSAQKAALDISGSLRVAPAAGAEEPKVAPPLGTQSLRAAEPPSPPPSRSEAIQSELASLGGMAGAAGAAGAGIPGAAAAPKAPPPVAKAPPAANAAAPAPILPPRTSKPSPPVRRAPGKKSALKRRQSSQLARPSVVLLLLLFFALAGGGAYLGFTSDGKKVLRDLVPQVESLWLGGGGKPASRFGVANLAGYYESNAAAGRMFVVKGQVTNEGTLRKTGVRINAVLLDAQNRTLNEKTAYAGNVFAADALRQANREKIEAAMSNPIGGGLANMDIPPGKSVPFMVVFFDAPDGVDSYRVEPRDVD